MLANRVCHKFVSEIVSKLAARLVSELVRLSVSKLHIVQLERKDVAMLAGE